MTITKVAFLDEKHISLLLRMIFQFLPLHLHITINSDQTRIFLYSVVKSFEHTFVSSHIEKRRTLKILLVKQEMVV